jgi:uncharacterized repeat protein (TIGR01451 family)
LAVLVVLAAVAWLTVGPQQLTTQTSAATQGASISGDADCTGGVNAMDALRVLSRAAGLQPYAACIAAGNVKCDDGIDAADSLYILRHVAALKVNLPLGCPPIGSPVPLSAVAAPEAEFYQGPLPYIQLPDEVSPGDDFKFTLTFRNTGPGLGYGPYIDLLLPTIGIDDESLNPVNSGGGNGPCDGIWFVQAEALFANPASLPLTTVPATGTGHAIFPATVATPPPPSTYCGLPVSVAHIGLPVSPLPALPLAHPFGGTFPLIGNWPGSTPQAPGGYELVVIKLPFGSYGPSQGITYVNVTAHLSDHADAGSPLAMLARGGFQYGDSQLGTNPPVPIEQTYFAQRATTPEPFAIKKVCTLLNGDLCPEDETATGPNFPMDYVSTVHIDHDLTIKNLTFDDILPDNVKYDDHLEVLIDGQPANLLPANNPPPPCTNLPTNAVAFSQPTGLIAGGLLELTFCHPVIAAPVTGTDIVITFQFYIPDHDADGLPILDAACDPVKAINNIKATGEWDPIDPRDAPLTVLSDTTPADHTLFKKCIAIQKTASPAVVIPDDTITYTLNFQVSDYLQMNDLVVTDLLSDGQQYVAGSATLSVSDKTGAFATASPAFNPYVNAVANVCNPNTPWPFPPPPPGGNGLPQTGTTVTFNVSGAMALYSGLSTTLPQGILTGGLVTPPTGSTPGATGVLKFQAKVQDTFDCPVAGDNFVDKFDRLYDYVAISGNVINRADGVSPPPPAATAQDNSGAVVPIAGDTIAKCIYSVVRGGINIVPPPGYCPLNPNAAPPQIAPGDLVTFRIIKTIPSGDHEGIDITDFLPHPVLQPTNFTFGQGPSNTCPVSPGPVPTPTPSTADNSLTFHYPPANNPNNVPCVIDILLAVKVTGDPYADGLLFTNEASECEQNSFNETICQTAIAPMVLTEPRLRITKGVVAACQPAPPPGSCAPTGAFIPVPVGPAGVTFLTPGTAIPTFTGTITSGGLAINPINSNANLDAGDIATFAIVVENLGSGLNGAFNVKINDTVPPGFISPGPPYGYDLAVTDGAGNQFQCVGGCLPTDLFGAGLELLDPGPINPAPGALEPYSPATGHNIAVITYELKVDPNVTVGSCFNNTATIKNYAGIANGPDHTAAVYGGPFSDTAQVCVRPSVTKSIVATSEAHTPNTPSPAQLTIGEIIRYRLDIVVPEGVTPGFQVKDVLPAGLSFMPGTDGLGISNFTTFINPHAIITGGPFDCSNAGADPVFNLDDLNNPGTLNNLDQDPDQEIIRIEFSALVCNVAGNQDGVAQNNYAEVSVSGSVVATSNIVQAVIVEPHVTITKLVAPGANAAFWNYTITLVSDGTADAFDVHLKDALPTNCIVYPSNSLTWVPVSPPWGTITSASTSTLVDITIDKFPKGQSLVIQFKTECGHPCDNSVGVAWTSLPGPFGTILNPTHSSTPGAGGAVDGERDGTGGLNDYETSASTAGPPCGTALTIIKDAVPDDPQDFVFTPTFTLDDDPPSSPDPTYSNAQNFPNLPPGGPYTVTETPVPGWAVSITCIGATNSTVTISGNSVSVTLAAGEHVTCTFTNTHRVSVDVGGKYNTPPGTYGLTVFNLGPWPITQIHVVDPLPPGVTFGSPIPPSTSGWDCSASTSTVVDCTWTGTLPPSATVALRFSVNGATSLQNCATVTTVPASNAPSNLCDTPPTTLCNITIIKDTVPSPDPHDFSFTASGGLTPAAFMLDDDNDPTLSNTRTFTNVACGAYTITETPPPNWVVSISCTGSSWSVNNNSVTINFLGAGASETCTFTNT